MPKQWFLAGIGGAGMAPLAIYLAQGGDHVCGFDDYLSPEISLLLQGQNIQIFPRPSQIPECDAVIHSAAILADDPLILQSKLQHIPAILRGNFLANLLRDRKLIAIMGSHGKTSTTACLIRLLEREKFPCDYLLGGFFHDKKLPAQNAHNEWIIAEIDESDGTIAAFSPEITVAINLEMDHEIYYNSEEKLVKTIRQIFQKTRRQVLFNENSPLLGKIIECDPKYVPLNLRQEMGGNINYFNGINHNTAHAIYNNLLNQGDKSSNFKRNHTSNNIDNESVILPNVTRRQEVLFHSNNLTFVADYAHHPTEIRAFLQGKPLENALVVFQPHRYSRTQFHWQDFLKTLQNIPHLAILPVYGAFENFSHAFNIQRLQQELAAKNSNAQFITIEAFPNYLESQIRGGHFSEIYFIGAGNIFVEAKNFIQKWRAEKFGEAYQKAFISARLTRNVPLKSLCTMRVGGNAAFYAEPDTENQLADLRQLSLQYQLPTFLLGRGSNLLVDDQGFEGLIVRLKGANWERCEFQTQGILCGGGLMLESFCQDCIQREVGGFEFLAGIPGSLGGAMVSNAGAHGQSIGNFVDEIRYLTGTGEFIVEKNPQFSYRCGHFPRDAWITSLRLRYPHCPKSAEEIRQIHRNFLRERLQKQPRQPSAGSVFKNPPDQFAGKLIEEVGLKGKCLGGAQISPVHANFIVNRGNAASADILGLIFLAKRRVREQFAIDLETELHYLSDSHCGPL